MKQCPRCIRPLEETSCLEVSLKGCSLCGGIWFPGGHLDLLAQKAAPTLAELDAQWTSSRLTTQTTWGTLWCPDCDFVELQPLTLFPGEEAQPCGCLQCQGIWLDDGMLAALQRQLEAGWQMPTEGLGTLISKKPAAEAVASEPRPKMESAELPPEKAPEEPEAAVPEQPLEAAAEPFSSESPATVEETSPPPQVLPEDQDQLAMEAAVPPSESLLEESPAPSPPPVDFEEAPSPPEPEPPASAPEVIAPPAVCASCGAELPTGAQFCALCGRPVRGKKKAFQFPPWREVWPTVWPLWKESLQPFCPGDSRKAWQGAALGALAGAILGLLTLFIPGWWGKLIGLVILFGGAAATAALVLYPEAMARRSPEGQQGLLLAVLTGLIVSFPLGFCFTPLLRPLLRGAFTGWALVVVMELGTSAYRSRLRDLLRCIGDTIPRFLRPRKTPAPDGD